MPSPFPGMDPYLENPRLWPDVHHELISVAREMLNVQLRPKYYVRVEERVYISDETDPGRTVLIPDLRVADRPASSGATLPARAVLEADESVEMTTLLDDEIHESRMEIIDHASRRVVTVIEIVSPTNKVPGSQGRASYLQKRKEVMTSSSHWVEIDLLRQGAPFTARETLPPCAYLVHVSRVQRRPKARVWPVQLRKRLPVVPVPLRPEDADMMLDLQTVLTTVYDRAAYDLAIDYRGEPVPPLTGSDIEWANEILSDKELRPA
jgi:hypothetical protein